MERGTNPMSKKVYPLLYVVVVSLVLWCSGEGFGFTLTVAKEGGGSGKVTSSPVGINCGSMCSADFKQGKKVTLKAKADAGSVFKEWGGACSGTGSCSVVMNSDVTVTANFETKPNTKIPEISVSPGSLDFGEIEIGKKVTKTLTISNVGTGDLQITISGLEDSDLSISGKSTFTVKPQKSYNLKVTCKPTEEGSDTDPDAEGLLSPVAEEEADEELDTPDVLAEEERGQEFEVAEHMKMIYVNSNDQKNPTKEVPVIYDTISKGEPQKIHIEGSYTFTSTGVNFDLTEKGDIPLEFHDYAINCGLPLGEACIGNTDFTSKGTITLDTSCTLKGGGKFAYNITGHKTSDLKKIHFKALLFVYKDNMNLKACCDPLPCAAFPFDSIAFIFAELHDLSNNGVLTCDMDFKKGKSCTVPISGTYISGKVTFKLQ
jgi:hypothetical protein